MGIGFDVYMIYVKPCISSLFNLESKKFSSKPNIFTELFSKTKTNKTNISYDQHIHTLQGKALVN